MFDFDISILDAPGFKEDSVREEIIVPILKRLGYSASGPNQIVRSKTLPHPFVMIGSKKYPVNIIPDYILYSEGRAVFVLDAKRPDTKLVKSKHAEQAFSYAIHPDIRVKIYALCNGRQLVTYDINNYTPIFILDFADIDKEWDVVRSVLSPENLALAPKRYFQPDFGIAIKKMGYPEGASWIFPLAKFSSFMQVSDELFTMSTTIQIGCVDYLATFDASKEMFMKILSFTDSENRTYLLTHLRPGTLQFAKRPILANLDTLIGTPTQGDHEVFVPLIIKDASRLDECLYSAFE